MYVICFIDHKLKERGESDKSVIDCPSHITSLSSMLHRQIRIKVKQPRGECTLCMGRQNRAICIIYKRYQKAIPTEYHEDGYVILKKGGNKHMALPQTASLATSW